MKMSYFGGVALCALLAAGTAEAASPANALVIGTTLSTVSTLDPAVANGRTPSEVVANIYDTLVEVPATNLGKLTPALAESWTVSEDKRSITLKIRSGATFASGNPVTAEDAAWSIRRLVKIGGVGASDIAVWGFNDANIDQVIQAVDTQTLVIKLPQPVATDLVMMSLTSPSLSIVDSKTVRANEANGDLGQGWLKSNGAGSGPYKLTQWRPNDVILCDARTDYWRGTPAMKRVIMRNIPESGNLRLQMEAGDVDVGQYMASGDLEAIQAKGMAIDPGAGLGFYYIAMNQQDPDLAKPLVRQAFQHIFDWKPFAATTMKYSGFPWQSIVPEGMPGAPTGVPKGYEYNPELAKELLAKAGYPNGLKKVLFPAGAPLLKMSVALQASAAKAGVDFEVVPGEHTPEFRSRKYQVIVGNSGARLPDPFGTLLQYAYNPDNSDAAKLGGYYLWRAAQDAPALTKLVEQSKTETDATKRKALFEQIDRDFKAMDPALLIFLQRMDPYAIRPGVTGYTGHPAWSTRWAPVKKS